MIDLEELTALIKTRRSVRRFQPRPVPEDILLKVLELAVWAPNGGNFQAWRFVVVTDAETIQKMGDAVKAKTELMASWPEAQKFGETVARWRKSSDFFRHAPACIAVFMGKYSSIADRVLRERGETDPVAREIRTWRETGKTSLQSAAAAISYICLLLPCFGLASTWMAGPLQAKREIEELLKAPADLDLVGLIPVGYPAESPAAPPRKPIQDVVQFIRRSES